MQTKFRRPLALCYLHFTILPVTTVRTGRSSLVDMATLLLFGRFEDRIPVRANFPLPSRPGLETTQNPTQ
jgi:hypothetical protein